MQLEIVPWDVQVYLGGYQDRLNFYKSEEALKNAQILEAIGILEQERIVRQGSIDYDTAQIFGRRTGLFNGIAGVLFLPFPIIYSADYERNIHPRKTDYQQRIFWIRPTIALGFTDQGSNFSGLGSRFMFNVSGLFFIGYNISLAWVESSKQKLDGLVKGINFFHALSIDKPVSKRIKLSLMALHLSNGGIFGGEGANFNSYGFGFSYMLNRIQ